MLSIGVSNFGIWLQLLWKCPEFNRVRDWDIAFSEFRVLNFLKLKKGKNKLEKFHATHCSIFKKWFSNGLLVNIGQVDFSYILAFLFFDYKVTLQFGWFVQIP